jgi:hypothetical protein
MKDERIFVNKLGHVGSFDGYEVVGVLYEEQMNVLHHGWKIMAYQKQYGVVNDYWIENGEFDKVDIEAAEKTSILKAINTWEALEREKLLVDVI